MHTKEANKKIISIEADESFDAHTVIDEITQLGHTLRLWMRIETRDAKHLVIFPSQ